MTPISYNCFKLQTFNDLIHNFLSSFPTNNDFKLRHISSEKVVENQQINVLIKFDLCSFAIGVGISDFFPAIS